MEMINSIHYQPNFTAKHIANAKNLIDNSTIELYELDSQDDADFLNMLPKKIQVKNLMPNLSEQSYKKWQQMLESACATAKEDYSQALLAVVNKTPCGIIAFSVDKIDFHLDYICTWPIEYGKKVALAGTTLIKKMFEAFIKSNRHCISLEAITGGPFPTVPKYKNLSFAQYDSIGNIVCMKTTKSRVGQTLKKLDKIINITPVKDKAKVKLDEILEF